MDTVEQAQVVAAADSLREQIAEARWLVESLRARVAQAEEERDAWRGHALEDCAALGRVWHLAEDLDAVPAPESWPVPAGLVGSVTVGGLIRAAIMEEGAGGG